MAAHSHSDNSMPHYSVFLSNGCQEVFWTPFKSHGSNRGPDGMCGLFLITVMPIFQYGFNCGGGGSFSPRTWAWVLLGWFQYLDLVFYSGVVSHSLRKRLLLYHYPHPGHVTFQNATPMQSPWICVFTAWFPATRMMPGTQQKLKKSCWNE